MNEVGAEQGVAEFTGEVIGPPNRVAILDAGAQYVDLIRRACVRLGYPADIVPLDTLLADIEADYGAFIVSGGPGNSHAEGAAMPDPSLWETDKAVMGICYGQHAMAMALGGNVEPGIAREDGSVKTTVDVTHPLFSRTKNEVDALFTHGDFVTEVPPDFAVIGEHTMSHRDGSEQRVISAMARGNLVATQFHPEVFDETPQGYDILQTFFADIAGLEPSTELLNLQTEADIALRKQLIAEKAGDRHVICFASGGIDSTVSTLLAQEVIEPDKLHVYYFDNGFMRDEDDDVIDMLTSVGINITKIDATEVFADATITIDGVEHGPLTNITNPSIKRKIIGKTFADYKDVIAAQLDLSTDEVMLLQGTNAADRIESGFSTGGQHTAQIVEHHNQVAEIKALEEAGLLIEPLADIHKDEIRRIAEHLGLPEEIAWRHPFPGPGNAIRILCARNGDYITPDQSVKENLQLLMAASGLDDAFSAQLLPVRSGGVGGDARSYIMPVALRGPADWRELEKAAKILPEGMRDDVSRVVYALTDTPTASFTLTETFLRSNERRQLRHVDRIVFEEIRARGLIREMSQCPIVLLPLSFGEEGQRSIVLRPVKTSTYLTARAVTGLHINDNFFFETAQRIRSEVPTISQVFLEITGKPPGRTEWE